MVSGEQATATMQFTFYSGREHFAEKTEYYQVSLSGLLSGLGGLSGLFLGYNMRILTNTIFSLCERYNRSCQ